MGLLGRVMIAGVAGLAALQLVRPSISQKPATAEIEAPTEVKRILEKNCYSCHSDQRRLSWFDKIVPGYWLVRHDILSAREHLNFSTLGAKPPAMQKATLYEAVAMIQLGAMPLPQFTRLHPESKVTPEELATLKAYLAPWTATGSEPGMMPGGGAKTDAAPAETGPASVTRISLASVEPEVNGLPFDPSFEGWKPISMTDRGDNNTFRFILGNEIAFKAAQSGKISPWPDGARLAKIAWQQQRSPDGRVYPGRFIQVELMIKNAGLYKKTEGWGWGRWRGAELKPYGKDANFVTECTTCHLPVRGDDYVYTAPITPANVDGVEVVNRRAAQLPPGLPYQPLEWNALTMFVDPRTHAMATLYGNETTMQGVRAGGSGSGGSPTYSAGAVLALVTWGQREDPHWFGARIPDIPRSVEFVEVAADGKGESYRKFEGEALAEGRGTDSEERAKFVRGLTPAWLP